MNRALIGSMLAGLLAFGACGSEDEENNNAGTNSTTATNNSTTNAGTNNETNNSVPTAGDCEWGDFIAACGGGPEPDLSGRAVGCRDYYTPTDASVASEDSCDVLWAEDAPCSDSGLSGRRPLGCCFELDEETQVYSRHCFYDDPLAIEASTMTAQTACEDAGFCWIPPEMM